MKFLPAVLSLLLVFSAPADGRDSLNRVSAAVARLLEETHYSRQVLDDAMSARVLELLLDNIDYNRLFLLQSDIDEFEKKFKSSLDEMLLGGDLSAAHAVYERYLERLRASISAMPELLADPNLVNPSEKVEIRRNKSPWPKNAVEQKDIWRRQIAAALLDQKLSLPEPKNGGPLVDADGKTPAQIIQARYDRLLRTAESLEPRGREKLLVSTLALAYDPHSEYNDPTEYKSFRIDIGNRVTGIGAMLRSDEGYTRITELVPGGPAALDGRLKVKDRIVAVAQGDGEFVDVIDMDLDKVVEMIRGPEGTKVRLKVIPGIAVDTSERRVIEIVRDEVDIKEKEAKAELIELPGPKGVTRRLGWIQIPSFYFDVERTGRPDAPSTSRHVALLLERLKKENVEGVVIDLSKNGGGALDEAIRLTGLFIDRGFVVQAQDQRGNIRKSFDPDPGIVYDGPVVVLTSRYSASASEIFAAALQDYGRAIIVGDHSTFGKGTVQHYVELDNWLPFLPASGSSDGALKVTIQKFYRITGLSTQFRGVISDIILPSTTDYDQVGESALRYPLPYDEVAPLPFARVADFSTAIETLRKQSEKRVGENPEFADIKEDFRRFKERMEANVITLNEKERRAEIKADKERVAARKAARKKRKPSGPESYYLTVENATAQGLISMSKAREELDAERMKHRATPDAKAGENGASSEPPASAVPDDVADEEEEDESSLDPLGRPEIDPIKDETLAILLDFIALNERQIVDPAN